jgi:hypothetical protein
MRDRANELPIAVKSLIAQINLLINNPHVLGDDPSEFQLIIKNLTFEKLQAKYVCNKENNSVATWIYLAGRQDILDWIYQRSKQNRANEEYLLHWAVLCRQTGHTITELKQHVFLVERQFHFEIPLHIAVRENNLDMARLLGYPTTYNNAFTPLHLAVAENKIAMLKLLLELKANPDAVDCDGYTPLHLACKNGSLESISELIGVGGNPLKVSDNSKDTALHIILRGEKNVSQLIDALQIKNHAGINLKNRAGLTPFAMAAKNGDIELVQRWLTPPENKDGSVYEKPTQETINRAFREAVKQGRDKVVSLLIPHISNIKEEFAYKPGSAICIAANRKFSLVVAAICKQRVLTFINEREKVKSKPNSMQAENILREIAAARALLKIIDNEDAKVLDEHQAQFKRGELKVIKDTWYKFGPESYQPPQNMTIEPQQAETHHGNGNDNNSNCNTAGSLLFPGIGCGL